MKSRFAYEAEIASTRDRRMAWWREARYGMFIHCGVTIIALEFENSPRYRFASYYPQLNRGTDPEAEPTQ